MTIIMQGFRF